MRLALIAGQGQLPAALAAGLPEVPLVCALQGFMPAGLAVDLVFRLETLGSFLHQLQQRGITHLCMCGAIRRPAIDPAAIDAATRPLVPVLQQALAAGDDGALRAVIGLFQDRGITVLGAHQLAPDLLMPAGCPTRAQPSAAHRADLALALQVLDDQAAADLGQACRAGPGGPCCTKRPSPAKTCAPICQPSAPIRWPRRWRRACRVLRYRQAR